MTRELNRIFYDVDARTYDRRHPEVLEGNSAWWKEIFGLYAAVTDPAKRRWIADIGAGTGQVARAVAPMLGPSDRVVCYDLSIEMLRRAEFVRGDIPAGISCVNGDASCLAFRDETLDIVIVSALLHHLPDCTPLVAQIHRALAPGGLLCIAHEPNRDFFGSLPMRVAATLYKAAGMGKKISAEARSEINRRLWDRGLIRRDLSADTILRGVEVCSPVEQSRLGIDRTKGFSPQEFVAMHLEGKYSILELKRYTTFFIRPAIKRVPFLTNALKRCSAILGDRGNLFSLVARKL